MHNDRAPWPGPAARFRMEAFESSHMQHFSRNAASLDPYKLALANGVGEMEINLQHQLDNLGSSFAYQLIGLRGPCRIGCNESAWEGGMGSGDWLVSLHDRCRNHMKFDGRCSSVRMTLLGRSLKS